MLHAPLPVLAPAPIGLRPSTRRDRQAFDVRTAASAADLEQAEQLLQRYRRGLRQRFGSVFGSICLAGSAFSWREADGGLAAAYRPPQGQLLIAYQGRTAAGCVGLRAAAGAPGHALVERLFVEPRFRRNGLGHELLRQAGRQARELGYRQLRFALPGLMIAPFAAHDGMMLIDACG